MDHKLITRRYYDDPIWTQKPVTNSFRVRCFDKQNQELHTFCVSDRSMEDTIRIAQERYPDLEIRVEEID